MNILNIIDTIYESQWFPTVLIISIIVLVILFIIVILLGMKDARKDKEPRRERLQDLKDVTFETPNEEEAISEDVTFEIPVLTTNLENFKKSLEEEIEREEQVHVIKETAAEEKKKNTKVFDKATIDNTAIVPIITLEEKEEQKVETIKDATVQPKEEPHRQKREILKEIFKDRKQKDVEPPKMNQLEEKDPQKNYNELKKEEPKKIFEHKKTLQTQLQQPQQMKKETKYSGDDDF